MKLIVDAQLPAKLCEVLNQLGLESIRWLPKRPGQRKLGLWLSGVLHWCY